MSDNVNSREGEIVRRHTVRSPHRRPYADGLPEFGTEAFDCLSLEAQHRIALIRAGLAESGEGFVTHPRPSPDPLPNPIDEWR